MDLEITLRKLKSDEPLTYTELCYIAKQTNSKLLKTFDKINGKIKYYYYMITFTIDPAKQDLATIDEAKLYNYVKKQLQRKPLKIVEAYLVQEGGRETAKQLHFHASVKTEQCLKKDRFNYYQKLYGNIDINRSKNDSLEESKDYISKDNTPERVV